MEVRLLNAGDAEQYFGLRLEALQRNPEAFASSYEEEKDQSADKYKQRFQSTEDSFTLGAFADEQLAGVITLVKARLWKMRHRANIAAMYVTPEKRGSGIGKSLLSETIKKATAINGLEQIYLTVVTSNDKAKQLYKLMGFTVFATENRALKFEDTYYDEHHMVMYL